ncbi:MAG: hypothetical protein J7L03_01825 [Caldisericaceae bacterium]|nr:hypothetical protein [Caldisericaceae bacterium]
MFNSRREKIKIFGTGKIIEADVSRDLASVLYINGKKGKDISLWSAHHVPVTNGKVEDKLPVLLEIRTFGHGITHTKKEKINIPYTVFVDIKNIGTPKKETIILPEMEHVRIPNIINGRNVIDQEIWERLTSKQQAHLTQIDTWDAYDELIKWFKSEDRKPSFYIGALQQIYNRTKRLEKYVHKTQVIETHTLINVDIDIKVVTDGFQWNHHINGGSIEKCKGQIIRSYAFNIPRSAMIKSYLKEVKI